MPPKNKPFNARLALLLLSSVSGLSIPVTRLSADPAIVTFPNVDIDGSVLSAKGKPVAGAKVMWFTDADIHKTRSFTVLTGKDGQFHFNGKTLWAGKAYVAYVVVEAKSFGLSGLSFPYGITPHYPRLIATLQSPTQLRVRFLMPNGRPAAGVTAHIYGFESKSVDEELPWNYRATTAISAADGTATFRGLPQGLETIVGIDDPRFDQLQYPVGQQKLSHSATTLWPDIKLVPAALIEGTLVDADGKPVSGVGIVARISNQLEKISYAKTDSTGHFLITRMLNGQYNVSVDLQPPLSDKWTIRDVPVTLAPGAHRRGVKLKLVRGAVITGHVSYIENGKPAVEDDITVKSLEKNGTESTVYTDAQGNYRICVIGGKLSVKAMQTSGFPAHEDVTVENGESRTVDFKINAP